MNSDFNLYPFEASQTERWDGFCDIAHQATFLHKRRFLSYHGDRFQDCSLMLEHNGKLVGLFPAACHLREEGVVVSHPGISYGGMIHAGAIMRGEGMVTALAAIAAYYAQLGFKKLVYKAVPTFYHAIPAQDDLYALFRLGAIRTRCDLSSTVDLANRLPVSERRRRGQKRAIKAGVSIVKGNEYLEAFWSVLADNLKRKHGVQPVHSDQEITLLARRFPENIECVCALLDGRVEAGVLLFSTPRVNHAQYIASSEKGYGLSMLDLVFESCIEDARATGKRWFDFGISTENSGLLLNQGLYGFKSEFGGGGFVHEFYDLHLGSE